MNALRTRRAYVVQLGHYPLLIAAAYVLLAGIALGQPARVVFEDNFTNGLKPQWTSNSIEVSTAPNGQTKYLGPFGGESVLLKLDGLPDHQVLRVSMDVLVIRSWDGSAPMQGPDIFYAFTDDGRLLHGTTFGWFGPQAYPGFFSVHTAAPRTGATRLNSLGFVHHSGAGDAIYHFEMAFPHRGTTGGLRLLSTTQSGIEDEGWGILNIRVTAENTAVPAARELARLVDQLGAEPAEASAALWKLSAAGEPAVAELGKALANQTIPADIELITPTRGAMRRLPPVGKDGFAIEDPAQRRKVMALHALQIIGSDSAKRVLASLPIDQPDRMKAMKIVVRDRKTRQPISYMPVWGYSWGTTLHSSILTDAEGVAITNVPNEVMRNLLFQNQRSAYVPVGLDNFTGQQLPLTEELLLDRTITIGGVVVDENKKPVEGATVVVRIPFATAQGQWERLGNMTAVTDREGKWTTYLAPEAFAVVDIGIHPKGIPATPPPPFYDFRTQIPALKNKTAELLFPSTPMVRGRVIDTQNRRVITNFKLSYGVQADPNQPIRWNTEGNLPAPMIRDETFEIRLDSAYPAMKLRIEADGYSPAEISANPADPRMVDVPLVKLP